jgi:hypothetical protein
VCVGCPVGDFFAVFVAEQGGLATPKMPDLLRFGSEKTAECFLLSEIQSFEEYAMP